MSVWQITETDGSAAPDGTGTAAEFIRLTGVDQSGGRRGHRLTGRIPRA